MNAVIPGFLSMLFWGVAIFLAAIASRKIGNFLTLFWMQVFGFLFGGVYFLFNFQTLFTPKIISFVPIIIVIAVLQLIAYLAFYKGLTKGQVSLVSPLGASWGLIAAVLGIIFYHESLTMHQITAILLIIGGIVTLSIDFGQLLKSKKIELFAGVPEGIISMLGWGVSLFLLTAPTRGANWFLPSFLFRAILILFLGSYMLISKKSFVSTKTSLPWGLLAVIGIFDFAAFMSLSLGVLHSNSSLISPIASANTMITILLAQIFLKESLKLRQIIGILAILGGIIIIAL